MIAMEELLSLKWNNHRSTFLHILAVLRDKQLYTDVTIACDGKFYNVHKMVLSTCSDYFSAMFDKTAGKVPIIVLKDIKSEDLEALLDYMYLGEVNVRQSDLASLIKSAECLRIKGLAVPDDEPPKKVSSNNLGVNKVETNKRTDSSFTSPPPKKKRKESDDGREDVRPVPLPIPPPQAESPPLVKPSPAQLNNSKDSLPPESIPDLPPVKQEMEEPDDDGGQETYDISDDHDHYKEEMEDPPDLSNELPDFLQSSSSYQSNFPSTSFQPDMLSWQGDQNFSSLNYGAAASSSNDPGGNVGNPYIAKWENNRSNNSQDDSKTNLNQVADEEIEIHFGRKEMAVTCPVCSKVFIGSGRRYKLQRHFVTHTGVKPYPCSFCAYRANVKDNLARHVKTIHPEQMMNVQNS